MKLYYWVLISIVHCGFFVVWIFFLRCYFSGKKHIVFFCFIFQFAGLFPQLKGSYCLCFHFTSRTFPVTSHSFSLNVCLYLSTSTSRRRQNPCCPLLEKACLFHFFFVTFAILRPQQQQTRDSLKKNILLMDQIEISSHTFTHTPGFTYKHKTKSKDICVW